MVHIARMLHPYVILMPPVIFGIIVLSWRVYEVALARMRAYLVVRCAWLPCAFSLMLKNMLLTCSVIYLRSVPVGPDSRLH